MFAFTDALRAALVDAGVAVDGWTPIGELVEHTRRLLDEDDVVGTAFVEMLDGVMDEYGELVGWDGKGTPGGPGALTGAAYERAVEILDFLNSLRSGP